jgi:hypothetical protein
MEEKNLAYYKKELTRYEETFEWWSQEMDKAIAEIDFLTASEWFPQKDMRVESVIARMNYLLAKGEFERRKLDEVKNEINKKLKNG